MNAASRITAAVTLATALLSPSGARAQDITDRFWETRAWVGEVTFLGVNSLVAGITAGIIQELRDGSFQQGFAKGALGGAIAYGGRRLAVEDFDGAGLLGRQIGAAGASMTRNAGEGVPLLSRLQFPVGPITFDVLTGAEKRVTPRVNLLAAGWIVRALLDDRMQFDGRSSLSAGVPVFNAPDYIIGAEGGVAGGATFPGLILIGHDLNPGSDTFVHERAHVAQMDFAQIIWGDPVERWATERIFGSPRLLQYIQPGVLVPLLYGASIQVIRYEDRPWEIEASFLEQR